jgi:8-oxo-dGTP pyrophosphatase MutT (NUDIX family)
MNKLEITSKLRKMLMEQDKKKVSAGAMIKCTKTDKIFLALRSKGGENGETWNIIAGGIEDDDKSILDGLKREIKEELQIDPDVIDFKFIRKEYRKAKNQDFHYYEGLVDKEFTPTLNEENLDWGWYGKDELPSPLYPNITKKIEGIYG